MTREQEGGQIVGGCCGSMAKQNCIKEDISVTVSFSIEEKKEYFEAPVGWAATDDRVGLNVFLYFHISLGGPLFMC